MEWIAVFTLLIGGVKLITATSFLYATWLTWRNPHPVGRRFMPDLVFALGLDYANEGFRKIGFIFDSSDLHTYVSQEGLMRLGMSNTLSLLLCFIVVSRTIHMIKDFKKEIA